MALPTCPDCGSDDLDLVEKLSDGRRHLVYCACDHDWLHGDLIAKATPPFELRGRSEALRHGR